MEALEDDYLFQMRYKRHRANKNFFILGIIVAGTFWMVYQFTGSYSLTLFNSDFLPMLSEAELIACGVTFIASCIFKEKLKFYKGFLVARTIFLLNCLGNISLYCYLFIINTNEMTDDNKDDCYYLTSQLATIFFITSFLIEECRQQNLMIQHVQTGVLDYLREWLQQLPMQQGNNNQGDDSRISLESLNQSLIQPVYGKVCTICDEEALQGEKVVQLPCMHVFHPECIRKWIQVKPFCPNCRFDLLEYKRTNQ